MTWLLVGLVGLAGGVGAVARFVVDAELRSRFPREVGWPILLVNLVGSLLLGVLASLVATGVASPELLLVAGTGFCGGFTTFSTAMLDVVHLAQRGRPLVALAVLLGGATACLLAALLGWAVV